MRELVENGHIDPSCGLIEPGLLRFAVQHSQTEGRKKPGRSGLGRNDSTVAPVAFSQFALRLLEASCSRMARPIFCRSPKRVR